MLKKSISAEPGQYIMMWLPRVGEIPLSISMIKDKEIRLIIARKGKVTSHLFSNINKIKYLHIRGPYGRGFTYKNVRKALIIGGGYGLAPLRFLATRIRSEGGEIHSCIGFKTKDDAILLDELKKVSKDVYISTNDGSLGIKGTVISALEEALRKGKYDKAFVCGPELMEKEVLTLLLKNGISVEVSLERLIRCSVGICGSCVLEPHGLLVCKDGPVFSGEVLANVGDFGKYWHERSGRKVIIGNV